MKKNDFYTRFIDFLEVDSVSSVDESTKLKDLAEYDSFFVLAIVAFVDENFSKNLTSSGFCKIRSKFNRLRINLNAFFIKNRRNFVAFFSVLNI